MDDLSPIPGLYQFSVAPATGFRSVDMAASINSGDEIDSTRLQNPGPAFDDLDESSGA